MATVTFTVPDNLVADFNAAAKQMGFADARTMLVQMMKRAYVQYKTSRQSSSVQPSIDAAKTQAESDVKVVV